MIEHIITSGILIFAVILIRAVFQKRISKRVCYAIWLLVVVKLMVPLSGVPNHFNVMNILSLRTAEYEKTVVSGANSTGQTVFDGINDNKNVTKTSGDKSNDEKEEKAENKELQVTEYDIEPAGKRTGAKPVQSEKPNIAFIFVTIWAVGSGIMACIMLTSNFVFQKRLHKNCRMAEGIFPHQRPLVYVTEEVEIPCLFGLWHPAIYITEELLKKDAKTLEMIIMHETIHYRHMDHIWSLIRCMLLVIYWWNPLVLIAAGLSVVDSELACDEGVIAKMGEQNRKAYGENLIAIGTGCRKSAKLLVCGVGLAGRNGELKTRMKSLAGKRKQSVTALVLACILLAGATGCTFGGVSKQDVSLEEYEDENSEYQNGGRVLVKENEIAAGSGEAAGKSAYEKEKEKQEEEKQEEAERQAETEAERMVSIKTTFEPQEGAVNIGYSPVVFGDDRVRYFVPEEEVLREKLLIALEPLSLQNGVEDGGIVGEQSLGCSVFYNGMEWELFSGNCLVALSESENGEIVQIVETPETNWNCVNICEYVLGILSEQMHYEPADVTAWTGITSATLDYLDYKTKEYASQTITDKETLKMLEQWFSGAEVINGGSGCPFHSAMLTFTFENGEKASMMVAEDSCSVFKVNGVYYDYCPAEYRGWSWDNETFKKLFDEIPFKY